MSARSINAVASRALLAALVATPAIGSPMSPGGTSAAPAPQAAMPNIDACVARLDPQLDIGYDRIAARCPDLMKQLETGAWAPWLPRGWKEAGNDLSAGSLKEFRELVDRESSRRETSPTAVPSVHTLQPILTALAGGHSETGWSRFKSWLRSVLERPEQPTDESWFNRIVSHVGISQSVIRLITYAALGATVVLAGIIVLNELKTAGLLGKRAGFGRNRSAQPARSVVGLGWSDIEQAALRDRPRMLLELIVRRLSDRGALPPSGALTVRELTRAVELPEADDRSRLAQVALAAERVRYSGSELEPGPLDAAIARGRELLERVEADRVGLKPGTLEVHAGATSARRVAEAAGGATAR